MYQIYFYVPLECAERVKEAMFQAGAGKIGNYQKCAWQVKGDGQFEPLAGANPALGTIDTLEHVAEYRVDMVCQKENLKNVLEALLKSHPYEEVAYGAFKILTLNDLH